MLFISQRNLSYWSSISAFAGVEFMDFGTQLSNDVDIQVVEITCKYSTMAVTKSKLPGLINFNHITCVHRRPYTAFFIIPIPASRSDMDSAELITVCKADTNPYHCPWFIPSVFPSKLGWNVSLWFIRYKTASEVIYALWRLNWTVM